MKHVSFCALGAFVAFGSGNLFATPVSHMHANGITANNIAVMQHSIMLDAFNNFDGSVTQIIGEYTEPLQKPAPEEPAKPQQIDRYGEMLFYGEYGDDGTVFLSGRNGGDSSDTTDSVWIDWQHAQDYAKFDGFKRVNSHYDLISLGFADEPLDKKANTFYNVGGFGGFVTAREDAHSVKLSETGEYAGVYYAYYTHGLMLQTAANFGVLFNDAKSEYGKHDFTNMWAGGALNATYNLYLDEISVLQPGIYAGYTWIHTDGYEPQPSVASDNFHLFEVSPSLRVMTSLVKGWYNSMSVRYVFNFANGGETRNAGVALPELELLNYFEYGFTTEKNIDRFNFSASINRRDGGRTGWLFNVHMKYMF